LAISVRFSGLNTSALANPPLDLPVISFPMLAPIFQILLALYTASMYCKDACRRFLVRHLSTASHVKIVATLIEGNVINSFIHYNFCWIHKTLPVTTAMEAGIADHAWSFEELRALLYVKPVKRAT
jgi:hypothetical protein